MKYKMEIDGRTREIEIIRKGESTRWHVKLDGQEIEADAVTMQSNVLSLLMNGKSYRALSDPRSEETAVVLGSRRIPYTIVDPRSLRSRSRAGAAQAGKRVVKAPMPGRIIRVLVQQGESVVAHQGVLVMEAMKMQNELQSPSSGTVTRIAVQPGDTVQPAQVLVTIE
ncbi:MAG TPA: biotin/lipoyl-containing protein [Acidobacteriaceae bacterium]|nr:biotin/lipoyl-containing protein [Acidobacteriaceae bacterium]